MTDEANYDEDEGSGNATCDSLGHDDYITYEDEDEDGYNWECRRCGAEGWVDAPPREARDGDGGLMDYEWCVMHPGFPNDPHRGPMSEEKARAWVREAEEEGFRKTFYVARRPVAKWERA